MTSISGKPDPMVLHITVADVVEALSKGLRDLQALPSSASALERCMRSAAL